MTKPLTIDLMNPLGRPRGGGWSILCDFDGTISDCDVADRLIDAFGDAACATLEDDWKAGRIGSRACMAGQVARLDMDQDELDSVLDSITLDPDFAEFARTTRGMGIPLTIVSDGLDYAIHRILRRYRLRGVPVLANRLVRQGERRWALEFPYGNPDCRVASGHCKCLSVDRLHHRDEQVLFIGDGASDFCASGRADHVFAKGRLVDYCREKRIAHSPMLDFADALAMLPALLAHDHTPFEALTT